MESQLANTTMDVDEPLSEPSTAGSLHRSPLDLDVVRASSEPWHPVEFSVGYVYDVAMMTHESENGHPEQPNRILYIMNSIVRARCHQKMRRLPIRGVKREEALLVHSEDHWDKVLAIKNMTKQEVSDSEQYYEGLSLYVSPNTPYAARLSCGGVIEASLAVARNELKKTFAIVRPPGHHAEPHDHMGFCFFNNVAVATRVVQQLTPIKKVLILDWDVHHGNGTQRAFYDDPSVLYVSIHRYEQGQFYPCGTFGSMESCGEGNGRGYSVNVPWPEKGMKDADYIHAFQKVVMPIATEFAPELVIISAGFDAADGDDLGECHVTPGGYAHMTHMLSGLANGRVVVALEGGYNLDSISNSALAVTRVLLGESPPEMPPLVASESATETVWQVAREQSKYWKSVDPKACEPREDMERMTFSIPEILKAHRQHYLYTRYNMVQIPLLNKAMEERFGTQVMGSPDVLEKSTMVILVHEFGNLRVELANAMSCDVQLEHSYHVDFSTELIAWVKAEGYALLDINLFPRPFATTPPRDNPDELARGVLTYLFDNYIQLSDAKRVILIGHGPGCNHLIEVINHRSVGVMQLVQAIIQVVGPSLPPSRPRNSSELRSWYRNRSLVILSKNHLALRDDAKLTLKHGKIITIDEPKPTKLVMKGLPFIQEYVKATMESSAMRNTTSRTVNAPVAQSQDISVTA